MGDLRPASNNQAAGIQRAAAGSDFRQGNLLIQIVGNSAVLSYRSSCIGAVVEGQAILQCHGFRRFIIGLHRQIVHVHRVGHLVVRTFSRCDTGHVAPASHNGPCILHLSKGSSISILRSIGYIGDDLASRIDAGLQDTGTASNRQSIGIEFCITRGNGLDTGDVIRQFEGDFTILSSGDNLVVRTAECSGLIHSIGPGSTIITAVLHCQIGRDLAVIHFDIIGMSIAVGRSIIDDDTAIRGFYRGAPCIDPGLGCQAGDLDGLFIGHILGIHHIQRNRTIGIHLICLILRIPIAYQTIVTEAVFLQDRVQIQIHRTAAQSGHGHMVGLCANCRTGNVIVLQAGNSNFRAIIHGQGCTARGISLCSHIIYRSGRNLGILQAGNGSGYSISTCECCRTIAVCIIAYGTAGDVFILCRRDAAQVGQFYRLRLTVVALECNFLIGTIFGDSRIRISQGCSSFVTISILQCQRNCIAVSGGRSSRARGIELVVGCVNLDGPLIVNLCRRIRTRCKTDAICQARRLVGAVSTVFQVRSSDCKGLECTICIRFRRNGHIAAPRYADSLHSLFFDGSLGHIELDGTVVAHCCCGIGTIGKDKAICQMD